MTEENGINGTPPTEDDLPSESGELPSDSEDNTTTPNEVTDAEEEAGEDEEPVVFRDPRTTLRENLCDGFKALKLARDGTKAEQQPVYRQAHSYVTVNYIDPTSVASGTPTSNSTQQKFSFMSPLGGKGPGSGNGDQLASFGELNLYEKVNTIFERDYGSTLHSVPYEHIRTNAPGTIDSVPIRTVLTQSRGTGMSLGGGNSGPISDPAEWHNGPYCHVYIAACESVDHYRSKVRPSLQAFVSQIEGANRRSSIGGGTKSGVPATANNYSSQYVIVYVPVRTEGSAGAGASAGGDSSMGGNRRGVGAIGSRLAAARRNITSAASREISSDSAHSNGSGATEFDSEGDSAAPPPGPVMHSSKAEKEIFKKFIHDFPNGRTVILSTLMDSEDDATMSPLKNQEWNGFLRNLGSAVVSGFRDRCSGYDEELRRLDAARASGNRNLSSKLGTKGVKSKFDLGHFFLVKESVAFTYEQMRIPAEALLQYEELRAFLPETSGDGEAIAETDDEKSKREETAAKRQSEDFDEGATSLAVAGDTLGFRRRLRAVTDLGIVEQTVLQYLYARETALLFQLQAPVEILRRAHSFAQDMYKMKCKGVGVIEENVPTEEEAEKRKVDAELWALNFCWDVKCATDNFFTVLQINEDKEVREFSFSSIDDGENFEDDHEEEGAPSDPAVEDTERRMASKIGELLEFSRLRFLRLGDEQELFENPIRKLTNGLPADLLKPWEPWAPSEGQAPQSVMDESELESPTRSILKANDDASLLDGAFESEIAYENRYLQIAGAVGRCNRLAGRRRFASRFSAELFEIYMSRQNYQAAVKLLLPIVDVCAADGWDRCNFWHLFRLACCQRTRGKIPAYLNTLTLCFGPHITGVAPKAAAAALQKDFEAVVSHPQVAKLRLGISSFLETDLVVEPTSGGKSSMLLNFVRKKLVKSFCKVGEVVKVKLSVRSHLPEPIAADAINILLVAFDKYEELFHNRELVSSGDAFAVIKGAIGKPTINPGDNEFEFTWAPMTTGIFTISTVQIQLHHGCFHYDGAILRKPLSALEVLPSDPTQTIELNPLFLIPSQVQQVRITFNAGTDIIKEGTVELVCSDGLEVIPPGTEPADDKWVETCSVDLPPCNEWGIVVLETTVKSRVVKSLEQKLGLAVDDSPAATSGAVQTMQARVMTSYYHKGFAESSDSGEGMPCMRTTLEAMVTTLDKPAFTVDECRSYAYSEGRFLITVMLHCNTPVPFSIKEWNVELPRLEVASDGDMNQDMFGHAISEGEQLTLAFNCSYAKGQEEDDAQAEPELRIVLQDEFGKTFNQMFPLDLFFFYDQMRRDAEYAVTNVVDAKLTCSDLEGLVGSPVTFSITIDASKVAMPPKRSGKDKQFQLLYKVVTDDTDWIVGGKVKGLLDCEKSKEFTVDFVSIPVRPGVLKQFPTLLVQYESALEDAPAMTVHLSHPDVFKSLSFVNHMALACPVRLEV